jgi:hypothetical protein
MYFFQYKKNESFKKAGFGKKYPESRRPLLSNDTHDNQNFQKKRQK